MKLSVLALVGALMLSAPAAQATDDADVMATINGFVDATMTGKPVAHLFTPEQSVLDEFAPYRWIGPKAVELWLADFGAMLQRDGVTEPVVKLGAPVRIETGAEHAYVVTPATYDFKLKGKAMHAEAMMAFALDRTASGWKIAALSWAGPSAKPKP